MRSVDCENANRRCAGPCALAAAHPSQSAMLRAQSLQRVAIRGRTAAAPSVQGKGWARIVTGAQRVTPHLRVCICLSHRWVLVNHHIWPREPVGCAMGGLDANPVSKPNHALPIRLALFCFAGLVQVLGYQPRRHARSTSYLDTTAA